MNALIFIAKVIGRIWVYAAIPFRGYAEHVVFNYVLQNELTGWLSRLWQRNPTKRCLGYDGIGVAWELQDIHGTGKTGRVIYRKVSKLEFYLVVFLLWGWLDNDANEQTCDIGYANSISIGSAGYRAGGIDRTRDFMPTTLFYLSLLLYFFVPPALVPVVNWLAYYTPMHFLPTFNEGDVVFGNAFDLGDIRADYPFFNFWCSLFWYDRNTAMNFQYLFNNY